MRPWVLNIQMMQEPNKTELRLPMLSNLELQELNKKVRQVLNTMGLLERSS